MVEKLILIQKHDTFVGYIYNLLINASNRYRALRGSLLSTALNQCNLLHSAIKSGMISLRSKLRLLGSNDPKYKLRNLRDEHLKLFLARWRGHIGHVVTYNLKGG